jgi:transcriptional regulator with XRE-family HTH domain
MSTGQQKAQLRDRLQEAMQLRGLRAIDLVDKTGIPKNTISYYLSGKTEPKADRLYALAVALDVSEAWLLGYEVPITRKPEQKKNDQLAQLVARLRADNEFFEAVSTLSELDTTQFQTMAQLLSALRK